MDRILVAQVFGFVDRAKNGSLQDVLGISSIPEPADKMGSQAIIAPR